MKPHFLLVRRSLAVVALMLLMSGCSHPALRQAEEFQRANQLPQAWAVLDQAQRQDPRDKELQVAQFRVRELLVAQLLVQIEGYRSSMRWEAARDSLQRLREVDPKHPRIEGYEHDIERSQRHETLLQQGRTLLREGKMEGAEARAREVLAESPNQAGARLLLGQIAQTRPLEQASTEMAPAFQVPVTLEFRDAPLRQVFETLARASTVNFVFDKEVRSDARVTIYLRNVTLDEAMRVILSTQQLDRKLLNDSSVLIFPNTAAKQREHQELITRTFYLTNADVKQVQAMVRTIAKVRDIHIDERLNLMVVRDTQEVMRLIERLIASVDLPEPEVMLEVEVMELATDRVDALGLQWPDSVQYGLPGTSGQVLLGQRDQFRASIANPGVVATLRGTSGNANLLANPKIRVRNRDKAKVQIGQKVPVFTTTSNFSVNTSVAASVSYLDVGLKLEVEPTVQLDNDVIIKVALEVSNLIRQVSGPGGSTAYEIGSRQTSTSLRLNDGETQILAGLINDEDRRSAAGVPGLSNLPLLGRLFGVQTDTRNKTEVVLLITPRIVRNLALPDAAMSRTASGTDASPGAFSTLLKSRSAAVGALMGSGNGPGAATEAPSSPAPTPGVPEASIVLDVTPQAAAGSTVSVTLRNESSMTMKGEMNFEAAKLTPIDAGDAARAGRIPFELAPRGSRVVLMRTLAQAAGQTAIVSVVGLSATGPGGEAVKPTVNGSGQIVIAAGR